MTGRVFRHEWKVVLSDVGVLLFFVVLPLLYPITYTLVYNPEVVNNVRIAVVDHSRTAASRELVRAIDATPAIEVYQYAPDLEAAKRLMAETEVYAILEIPEDYARLLGRGEQAHVPFYSDMSLLLRYRSCLAAMTDVQMHMSAKMLPVTIDSTPLSALAAGRELSLPIKSESNFLGDTEQGFASFVIPGIIILILQQSMILGICLIGGTSRERRRRNPYGIDPEAVQGAGPWATVWGKALCYVVFYIPVTIYMVRFVPEFFALPHYGNPVDYLLFLVPMLFATAFFGQALIYFMKQREAAFIIIVFTSVIFLFLSGLTWPRYAMSEFWTWAGNIVPATWGVEGFIRINSNGATVAECATAYKALWILTALYMFAAVGAAVLVDRRARRRAAREHSPAPAVQLPDTEQ